MKRRSPRLTEYPSYDSFLDFMTNVAGFLILLVVMTPLGVSRAVQGIQAPPGKGTPEDIQAAREEAERLTVRLEELRSDWKVLEASAAEEGPDLARLKELSKSLEREKAQAEVGDLNQERSALKKEVEENRRLLVEKRKEFDTGEEGMFQGWSGDRRSLRVPDPRKVPEDMKRFEFLCNGNRVCPFDMDELNGIFRQEALAVGALSKTPRGMSYDHRKGTELESRFRNKDFGNEFFRLTFSDEMVPTLFGDRGNIYLQYDLRKDAALEDAAALQAAESRYRKILKNLDPRKCWIYYFVYDDSLVTYYLARKVAEEMGFQAGWVAFSSGTPEEPEVEKLRFPLIGSSGSSSLPD